MGTAQSTESCEGVQGGALASNPKVIAVYSDCVIDGYVTGTFFHPAMTYDAGGPTLGITAKAASGFTPPPSGQYQLGMLAAFGIQDVGANYAGDCQDVTATERDADAFDGHTYCAWYEDAASGRRLNIQATLNKGSLLSVSFEHNVPAASNDANPVPALADWAWFLITLSIVTAASVRLGRR